MTYYCPAGHRVLKGSSSWYHQDRMKMEAGDCGMLLLKDVFVLAFEEKP
jgi:hypothetical protein